MSKTPCHRPSNQIPPVWTADTTKRLFVICRPAAAHRHRGSTGRRRPLLWVVDQAGLGYPMQSSVRVLRSHKTRCWRHGDETVTLGMGSRPPSKAFLAHLHTSCEGRGTSSTGKIARAFVARIGMSKSTGRDGEQNQHTVGSLVLKLGGGCRPGPASGHHSTTPGLMLPCFPAAASQGMPANFSWNAMRRGAAMPSWQSACTPVLPGGLYGVTGATDP